MGHSGLGQHGGYGFEASHGGSIGGGHGGFESGKNFNLVLSLNYLQRTYLQLVMEVLNKDHTVDSKLFMAVQSEGDMVDSNQV